MPPHSNFEFRDKHDQEAAHIATASLLKAIVGEMELQIDQGRIRQLIGSACGDDMTLIARAQWHIGWMLGQYDAEGEHDK